MKNFPIDKYKFYQSGNKIIAVSSYAGKTVKGIANCHPGDTFNYEYGKLLAAARCNEKVAIKRYARANKCLDNAIEAKEKAEKEMHHMADYRNESFHNMVAATLAVDSILNKINKKSD